MLSCRKFLNNILDHKIEAGGPPFIAVTAEPAYSTGERPEKNKFKLVVNHEFEFASAVAAHYTDNHFKTVGRQIAHAERDSQLKIDIAVEFKGGGDGLGCNGFCEQETVFLSLSPEPNESHWDEVPVINL